jgi:predicted dehydrogenase
VKQVTQRLDGSGVRVVEVPEPGLDAHGVLVRTVRSLISAGTERAKVEVAQSSLLEKARRRPEDVAKVLSRARRDGLLATYKMVSARLAEAAPLGYSAAGLVLAVGELVEGVQPGFRVACAGAGYANHAEVNYVPGNLCARVPDGVSWDDAAYTTVGAIAMQGFRQSGAALGDAVGVIGMGLLGQITAQIARGAGCQVLAFDVDPEKIGLARGFGFELGCTIGRDDALAQMEALTGARGLDAVIITASTQSSDPVRLAGEIARDRGTVVVVGDVGMDVPRASYYEKELSLRLSRSYGPGRYDSVYEQYGVDYPLGYVQWTERRNMEEFLRLVGAGIVDVARLTTHRFAIADASSAYDLVLGKSAARFLGVVLEYPEHPSVRPTPRFVTKSALGSTGALGFALVGAGNFATGTLLPALAGQPGVSPIAVVTASGLSAEDVGRRSGFGYATSDIDEVLGDPNVSLVVIATRHDTHAEYARRALTAGKHVFVEKPLAVVRSDIDGVVEAYNESPANLMVGFNRRFAPFTREVSRILDSLTGPVLTQIRVNAGTIAPDHWIQDVERGGGRIIGEVCHFVDLACHLARGRAVGVFAKGLGNGKSAALQDSLVATIQFEDGSLATITYAAEGDPASGKERVEVFCSGVTCVIDDFKSLEIVRGGKVTRRRGSGIDKGHWAEMAALVGMAQGRPAEEMPFESAVSSTLATFALVESLCTGEPVALG